MSRRILVIALAASAVLIAAPAGAEPECSGEGCRASAAAKVVDVAPHLQVQQTARDFEDARGQRYHVAQLPRQTVGRAAPAYVVNSPRGVGVDMIVPARGAGYVVSEYAGADGAVIVGAPGMIVTEDGVVAAYPYLPYDPAWRLCQFNEWETGRPFYCGPYSYQPFGTYGYRPYGTFRPYRPAPAYVIAPSARIIEIEPGN
jgi:hypothetical protein